MEDVKLEKIKWRIKFEKTNQIGCFQELPLHTYER